MSPPPSPARGDIIAERINDDAAARARLRDLYMAKGVIRSKVVAGKEEEGAKFKDYFRLERARRAGAFPSHPRHAPRRNGRLPFHTRAAAPRRKRCSSSKASS